MSQVPALVVPVLDQYCPAQHIHAGRFIPLLPEHMTDIFSLYLYYGSRAAEPARVRRFIDLAVDRLTDNAEFVLGTDELIKAQAQGIETLRR
jgi:DNA-binding transcriptional LysR family regulator